MDDEASHRGFHLVDENEMEIGIYEETNARSNLPSCILPSVRQQGLVLQEEVKMDGLLVLGESWNIVKLDGVYRLQAYPRLVNKSKSSFKGCDEYLGGFERIFEVLLLLIDGLTLSILVCTRSKLGLKNVDPSRVIMACHDGIRATIDQLDEFSASKDAIGYRLDGQIAVYPEDWDNISLRIREEISNHVKSVIEPEQPIIYFVAKRFGQDRLVTPDTIFGYPNIRLQNSLLAVVHSAHDFFVRDHLLWWKLAETSKSTSNVTKVCIYKVAALKGLGNMTMKVNRHDNVKNVQFYTRVFQEVHKDELQLLWSNGLTQILAKKYTSLIRRESRVGSKKLTRKESALLDGPFSDMLEHCIRHVGYTTPARLETVVAVKPNAIHRMRSVGDLIRRATEISGGLIASGRFGSITDQVHAIPSCAFMSRNEAILRPILNTLRPIIEGVRLTRNMRVLDRATCLFLLLKQDIFNLYTCNALLRYYFLGYLAYGFPTAIKLKLGLVEEQLADYSSRTNGIWPFKNILVSEGKVQGPHFGSGEIPKIEAGFWCHTSTCISNIQQRYKEFIEMPQHGTSSEALEATRKSLMNLAIAVVDYMVAESKRVSSMKAVEDSNLDTLWHYASRRPKNVITSLNIMRKLHLNFTETQSEHTRGIYPAYKLLLYIIKELDTAAVVPEPYFHLPFRVRLSMALDRKMLSEGYPLKFLFNQHREHWVLPVCISKTHNDQEKQLTRIGFIRCWKNAFNSFTSIPPPFQDPQFCTNVDKFLKTFALWLTNLSNEDKMKKAKEIKPEAILELCERAARFPVRDAFDVDAELLKRVNQGLHNRGPPMSGRVEHQAQSGQPPIIPSFEMPRSDILQRLETTPDQPSLGGPQASRSAQAVNDAVGNQLARRAQQVLQNAPKRSDGYFRTRPAPTTRPKRLFPQQSTRSVRLPASNSILRNEQVESRNPPVGDIPSCNVDPPLQVMPNDNEDPQPSILQSCRSDEPPPPGLQNERVEPGPSNLPSVSIDPPTGRLPDERTSRRQKITRRKRNVSPLSTMSSEGNYKTIGARVAQRASETNRTVSKPYISPYDNTDSEESAQHRKKRK